MINSRKLYAAIRIVNTPAIFAAAKRWNQTGS
jgi:hypothetical protein